MIQDLQQFLTGISGSVNGDNGQLFNAADGVAEYGGTPYDLKATAGSDYAIGEPLDVFYQVVDANSDVGTSLDIAVINDTDGAGGSAVVLVQELAVLVANLTVAAGVRRLGTIKPGLVAHQYLTARVTTHGSAATAGKIAIWFEKGSDRSPANAANKI